MERIIDPKLLDRLIGRTNLSPEIQAQLRDANEGRTPEKPKGHGAPTPTRVAPRQL